MFAKANTLCLERKSCFLTMYRALYKALKGGSLLKVLQLVGMAAALVAILFFLVFPYIDATFAEDPNING